MGIFFRKSDAEFARLEAKYKLNKQLISLLESQNSGQQAMIENYEKKEENYRALVKSYNIALGSATSLLEDLGLLDPKEVVKGNPSKTNRSILKLVVDNDNKDNT